MEAVRVKPPPHRCAVVMVTTDKVYENREIEYSYRETDPLGGHDPYSASKAAAEITIQSYRKSFFSNRDGQVALASARAAMSSAAATGRWIVCFPIVCALSSAARKSRFATATPRGHGNTCSIRSAVISR